MAVDRGGLNYNIVVEDGFTKPLQSFRTELLKSQAAIKAIRDETLGFRELRGEIDATTRSVQRRQSATNSATADERAAAREQIDRLRQLQAGTKLQAQNEKIRASLAREIKTEQEKAAKAAEKSAAAQKKASAEAAAAAQRAARENQKLVASLLQGESAANRVAFTFRRLFGILAAFTIARQAVQGFTGLITSAVDFNRTVEDSRIGVGSLLVALGRVRDASGQLVEGPQAFVEATAIAEDQMNKLRLDALRTTATFSELLETFQTALGPGLAAGLKLDEVRQLATLVSQAAAAMRIPQNQLAEEIRALTTPGAATSRTSLIFTRIGLTPDELKRAIAGGKLFELLQTRLKAFDIAAEATQKTFTGLLARIQDAVGLASGNASILFFESLKGLLKDIGDSFVIIKRDATGAIESITPNPAAVATLGVLFEGLRGAVETIRTGTQSLDLSRVQSGVALIANLFQGIAQVVVGFVSGLVDGLADLGKLSRQFFGSFDSPVLRETVALVTRLGVLLVGASLAAGALGGAFKLMFSPVIILVGLFGKLLSIVQVTSLIVGKIPGQLFTWTGILAAIGVGFNAIFEKILGLPVSLSDTGEIIKLSFSSAFTEVVSFGTIVFKEFANVLVGIFTDPIGTIAGLFDDLFSGVLEVASGLAAVLGISEDFRAKIEDAVAVFQGLSARVKPVPIFDTAKDRADLDTFIKDTEKKFADLAADIGTKSAANDLVTVDIDTSPAEAGLASFVAEANALLTALIGEDIVDSEGILEKLDALLEQAQAKVGTVEANQAAAQEQLVVTSFGNLIKRSQDFLQILTNSVSSFAAFAADAIVDAFDPTQDVDLKERFARLLQDIARQILQTLLTLLIATAIAKAFGVPLATAKPEPIPTLPSFAEGGPVDPSFARPAAKPSNIPSSDTVPAWLTPGEFVQTVKTVGRYGADFMEALRQGAIDPAAVRGLMDGVGVARRARTTSARTSTGYQTGGLVAATQQAEASAQAETGGDNSQPPIALIAGNNTAMERLLGGGKKAMLDFLRANNYFPQRR